MFYDFVRYKARILRTLSFNVLMFSVDIDMQSQIVVESVVLNSVPFVVTMSNESEIETIMACLDALHVIVDMDETLEVDIDAVALLAKHIQTNLQEEVEFNVIGRMPGARHIVTSLEELTITIVSMNTPDAVPIVIDSESELVLDTDMVSLVGQPTIATIEIGSALTCTMQELSMIMFSVDMENSSTLTALLEYVPEVALRPMTVEIIGQSGLTATFDFTYIADILVIMANTSSLDAAIDVLLSKRIQTDLVEQSQFDIVMGLVQEALLQNYDDKALSSLDVKTLQALNILQIQ